jgi:hypothetical protein
MDNLRVGRNDPCPCGSGEKFKKCCLHGRFDRGLPGFGYRPAASPPVATPRMAPANGRARPLPLEPDSQVKVFIHEHR